MRDNHGGMPEFVRTFEVSGHYFAVIEKTIDGVSKPIQFGISKEGYLALKKAFELRPFDRMPDLKYRYFYSGSSFPQRAEIGTMTVRVELGRDSKQFNIDIPKDLHSNLLWFQLLTNFDDAAYLNP